MIDLMEISKKNAEAKEIWESGLKETYRAKFEKYFDTSEKLDEFIKKMGKIVASSEDQIMLPQIYGLQSKVRYPNYSQTIKEDGSIDLEKFKVFLDNIENALSWVGTNDYKARESLEKAFPEKYSHYNIDFVLMHFVGNEKCKGVTDLILEDLHSRYKNSPEVEKKILDRIKKYEEDALNNKESVSLSNDMDKLFAGSSSTLGKGFDGKSKN